MATIPVASATVGGFNLTPTTATSGTDTIAPGSSDILLIVDNGNASATVVTVTVPGNTEWGVAEPDITGVSIPAAGHGVFRLPHRLADPSTGLITVKAEPNTSVSLFAVRAR